METKQFDLKSIEKDFVEKKKKKKKNGFRRTTGKDGISSKIIKLQLFQHLLHVL
jgi:hypothetical protein